MDNVIIICKEDFEYQAINKINFFKFLNEELKEPDLNDFDAHLKDAQNDLSIGNSSYELSCRSTQSESYAYYNFWL
jgi:hypothetical protein